MDNLSTSIRLLGLIIFNPVKASRSDQFDKYDGKQMSIIWIITIMISLIMSSYVSNTSGRTISPLLIPALAIIFFFVYQIYLGIESYFVNLTIEDKIPFEKFKRLLIPYMVVMVVFWIFARLTSTWQTLYIVLSILISIWKMVQIYLILCNRVGKDKIKWRNLIILAIVNLLMMAVALAPDFVV